MIINFGSLNIDYVYYVNHILKPGETLASGGMDIFPGGKGLNQSIAISRAGGKVKHAGLYGNEGVFLYDLLIGNNVDITFTEKLDTQNGHAIIQVDEAGENSILLFSGTNGMMDKERIDNIIAKLSEKDTVLLQNEISEIAYIMKKSKEKGCRIAFNPAPMGDEVFDYPLELVDIMILNMTEGMALSDQRNTEKIISSLKKKYSGAKILLTLGDRGAILKNVHDEVIKIEAFSVNSVVDTTAAGDTFIGYYLAGVDSGTNDKQALELASKAAALCITKKGAAPSIPYLEDLKNYYNAKVY